MNTLLLRRQLLFMMNERDLPYYAQDSSVKIDENLLQYFIERIAEVYNDYIENKWFNVSKRKESYWDTSSHFEENGLEYRINVYDTADVASSWSWVQAERHYASFDNFNIFDDGYSVSVPERQGHSDIAYVFHAGRTIAENYDGQYSLTATSINYSYFFGDGSYEHCDGEVYQFDYRSWFPIYCNKHIYTTDGNGVRGVLIAP